MVGLPFFRLSKGGLDLGRLGNFPFAPIYHVPAQARAAHMYVIGLSGKGKSKFLEHCVYQDIAAGAGCGVIDPHSQLVDDILRLLVTKGVWRHPSASKRLIYVDPARTDYIMPFNVLAGGGTPYDIASGVVEAFRRTWPESLSEAPHFTNVAMTALITLIENRLTLVDMPRLLTDQAFRDGCLAHVNDQSVVEFFHDRYDRWGREAPTLRESTLNKVGAFALNPRLKLMLGQKDNRLDFRAIMDEGKILLLDLGHCDTETNRLIGSLVVTGLELAMRRRQKRTLWNLTIDEFAGYVANEGSVKTLAHVFSEGRKFRMSMTVAHQDLSQLTPRMLGALSNVQTKVIFGIGRYDAEYFARMIGRVNTEAVKREAKTPAQQDMFAPLPEQWEAWVDRLRFQPARQATVADINGQVRRVWTIPIPTYQASEAQLESIRRESVRRWGIPYEKAMRNAESEQRWQHDRLVPEMDVPEYEAAT